MGAVTEINQNQAMTSYPYTQRKRIIEDLLKDEQIRSIIKRVAKRNNTGLFFEERRAKKILKEMTADLSVRAIRFAYRFFKFIWKKLYSRLYVNFDGLARLRQMTGKPMILIPSHKSHLDYLLLSSVFHENGLIPPFIAAGVNMAFWPFGHIFRKTGAYFIRRSIGNDILYYKLLFKYISLLLKENGTQEFFIEGGRSRNGKLQNPKLGLLTLEIDSFLEGGSLDICFVPVAISYDRILEENAYFDEITGGGKKKESLFEVLRSRKLFNSFYGDAYIEIGDPISLCDYQKRSVGDNKLTPKLKKEMIKKLGRHVAKSINSMMPVTATSIIALALLSKTKRSVSHEDLLANASLYLSYLKDKRVNISHSMEADERSILSGITLLLSAGFLKEEIRKRKKYYRFKNIQRIALDYYKNNLMHFIIPLLFASVSICRGRSERKELGIIKEDYRFLSKLFSNEFFIDDDFFDELAISIEWLKNKNIVSVLEENGKTLIIKKEPKVLELFANAIRNYIEAYYLTAVAAKRIMEGGTKIIEGNLINTILKIGLKMYKKEEILRRESITTPCISNALKYMNKNGISSMKNLVPPKDLDEEDEDLEPIGEEIHESVEKERLLKLIENLSEYLR